MPVGEEALVEHRALLREILRMANGDLMALWRLAETQDREVLFSWLRDGVPEIVEAYRSAAVDVGVMFYEPQGLVPDHRLAASAAAVNREQLEASLRWALFDESNKMPLSLVAGIIQKHVVDGARDYGIMSAESYGQMWMRAAHPGACNFCRLLATRGLGGSGGYTSAETAVKAGRSGRVRTRNGRSNQLPGDAFHENCMCVPVLAGEYTPPGYVLEWEQDYFKARKEIGGASDPYAILSQMRKISGHSH